jgi:isohexenylglutaconyl-CoA hydratase
MTALPLCQSLLLTRDGTQLHITLNRPETRNALSAEMVRELQTVVEFLEGARDIATVVLRGAGGTFCAGGDIRGFMASLETPPPAPGERDAIAVRNRGFGAFLARFDALPQTIVLVIEGAAFGGGLGLAAIGDVAIATADARFAMSETGLGIPPAQIAPFVAARIGLVHYVCEDATALDTALKQVLDEIARCAPGANAATKRLLLASRVTPLETLLDQASDAFAQALRSAEGREGVSAFLEKRAPAWRKPSGSDD